MPGGRPRAFDREQALAAALQVFWRHGYEGATLPQLTTAMGINRPSLYAAFGNKEALFRAAMACYTDGPAGYVRAALAAPTAHAMAEALLYGGVTLLTDPRHPRGCLMVQGALACGAAAAEVQQALTARRHASEAAVRQRLEQAQEAGELPPGTIPADLARYLITVLHGLSVQAAGGATRAELERVVATALRAWPG